MDKFTKITVGFVTQTFERNDKGRFVCTRQEFIAGDQCDYEDAQGNPIDPPDYQYQPYNMTLSTETEETTVITNKMYDAIGQVLRSLDVGGEQSRQFAREIKTLKDALKATPAVDDSCPKCGAGLDEREFTDKDFLDSEAIHMHYTCKKCGSQITEEFTLSDVFIDNGR